MLARIPTLIACVALLATGASAGPAQDSRSGFGAVTTKILQGKAFFFNATEESPDDLALVVVGLGDNSSSVTQFHTFPSKTVTRRQDLRWDIADDTLLCMITGKHLIPHHPAWMMLRYPIKELRAGPPGTPCLPPPEQVVDADGRQVYVLGERGHVPPNYGIVRYLELVGWRPGQPFRPLRCDVRAIKGTHVRIFAATDGRIFTWIYDGVNVQDQAEFPWHIDGPFRVAANGRSVIVRTPEAWIAVSDFRKPASAVHKFPVAEHDRVALFVEFPEMAESYLVQNDRYVRVGKSHVEFGKLGDAPELVQKACQGIWQALGNSNPLGTKTHGRARESGTGEGSVQDTRDERGSAFRYERGLLKQLLKTRHASENLRKRVLEVLRDRRRSYLKDDISVVLLSRLDKLDGADVLMGSYEVCVPHLKGLHLEEETRREWKEYPGLRHTLGELTGGELLGALVRYVILEELQEQAALSARKEEDEMVARRIESFVRNEASNLLDDWSTTDLKAMIEELAGDKR